MRQPYLPKSYTRVHRPLGLAPKYQRTYDLILAGKSIAQCAKLMRVTPGTIRRYILQVWERNLYLAPEEYRAKLAPDVRRYLWLD